MNIIGAYQRTNVPFEGLRVQSSRSSKFKVWFTVYSLRFIIHAHRVSLR